MTYLPDVNVWIAMYSPGHVHRPIALHWFERSMASHIIFCRVTQMGFLRLLTNHHVMGINALSPSGAWNAVDGFLRNPRIFFVKEPPGLEEAWRAIMIQPESGPNAWTDAYLTAFADQSGTTRVTFDARLAGRKNSSTLLLR